MTEQFNVEHQFKMFLERVKLDPEQIPAQQLVEMRRAFFGAWGQQLILMSDTHFKLTDQGRLHFVRDMINQVQQFWSLDTIRFSQELEERKTEGQKFEINITLIQKEKGKLKVQSSYPPDASAGLVCSQLTLLGQTILDKIQDKVAMNNFATEVQAREYVNGLSISDLAG